MIIRNERGRCITERLMRDFQGQIRYLRDNPPADTDIELTEAICRDMQWQVDDFQAQLQEYADIQAGKVDTERVRNDLRSLWQARNKCGHSLLAASMASGLGVDELARRTGIDADELREHEDNEYRSASLQVMEAVAAVLAPITL